MALTTHEEPSGGRAPSDTIWANCPKQLLIENGEGFYFHEEFLGGVADTVASGEQRPIIGRSLSFLGTDNTIITFKASEVGGYLDLATAGSNDNNWSIFSEPFCYLANNNKKIWLEGRLELGDATGQQGFFFGLAEEAALALDLVANDCEDLITETLIGFRLFDEEDAVDIVAQLDGGAEVVIASDVTNLDVLDTVLGSGSKAVLTTDTEVKLGLRFNGTDLVEFFVNSVRVATWTLDATYYDPDKSLGFISNLKECDGGGAVSAAFDWIRGAAEG